MNRRLVSVFLFALVIAGGASVLLYHFLSAQLSSANKPVPAGTLLVAAADLQVGSLIKDSDVQRVPWSGAFPDEAIKDAKEIVGRGVVATIYKGEPILSKRLAPKGAGAGLAATIPIGMRAVAMKVDDVVGVAGFVIPGMRVDVIVSSNGSRAVHDDTAARTILQNIEVLSAGQHIEKSVEGKPDSAQVVNLLVTPGQAEVLSLVSNETKVQLVLRNPLDTKEEQTEGASLAKLFGSDVPLRQPIAFPPRRPAPVRAAPEPPKSPTVEVFHGAKRVEETVDGGLN